MPSCVYHVCLVCIPPMSWYLFVRSSNCWTVRRLAIELFNFHLRHNYQYFTRTKIRKASVSPQVWINESPGSPVRAFVPCSTVQTNNPMGRFTESVIHPYKYCRDRLCCARKDQPIARYAVREHRFAPTQLKKNRGWDTRPVGVI